MRAAYGVHGRGAARRVTKRRTRGFVAVWSSSRRLPPGTGRPARPRPPGVGRSRRNAAPKCATYSQVPPARALALGQGRFDADGRQLRFGDGHGPAVVLRRADIAEPSGEDAHEHPQRQGEDDEGDQHLQQGKTRQDRFTGNRISTWPVSQSTSTRNLRSPMARLTRLRSNCRRDRNGWRRCWRR